MTCSRTLYPRSRVKSRMRRETENKQRTLFCLSWRKLAPSSPQHHLHDWARGCVSQRQEAGVINLTFEARICAQWEISQRRIYHNAYAPPPKKKWKGWENIFREKQPTCLAAQFYLSTAVLLFLHFYVFSFHFFFFEEGGRGQG